MESWLVDRLRDRRAADGVQRQSGIKMETLQAVRAGASAINATMPVGVPLAGYNSPPRRVEGWPIPKFTRFTTFMTPSEGAMMPLWVKCLVLVAEDDNKSCVCGMDAIGSSGEMTALAWEMARERGFTVPLDNVIIGASHTHSGPGGVAFDLLWELAPATDLGKRELQQLMASRIAEAMIEAERNVQPARIGVGRVDLRNVTRNRRANISPYVTPDSVDTDLAIIRVDKPDGSPLATLWNFAIHGTCFGPGNMKMSGDIMGQANALVERKVGGDSVAIFINSDTADIAPMGDMCRPLENMKGGHVLSDAVLRAREGIPTVDKFAMRVASTVVEFGHTNLNLTLHRINNCTETDAIDLCKLCSSKFLNCRLNLKLGERWVENKPRFTALNLLVDGTNTAFVTVPGEAIQELGYLIKRDAKQMGFDQAFVFGFANSHMGYFTTQREYEVGGYESLLTFWGINTCDRIREGTSGALRRVL